MAQTPDTPVHMSSNGDFSNNKTSYASPMSIYSAIKPAKAKSLSAKQKLQRAFAGLYDDEKEAVSSTWTSGSIQQYPVIDVTTEGVEVSATPEINNQDASAGIQMASESSMEVCIDKEDKAEAKPVIRGDWLGTSPFYLQPLLELQMSGGLDAVIAYREAVAHDVSRFAYDPVPLLTLSSTHGQLGFSDISVANAHRALLLIEAALQQSTTSNLTIRTHNDIPSTSGYPQLDMLAMSLILNKYRGYAQLSSDDGLQTLHLQAYHVLLSGLLGTAANWEGLVLAKTALAEYPEDDELQALQAELKAGFLDRSRMYKEVEKDMKKEDVIEATRMGKIYQKKYPWMDQILYNRTPATLREANKGFAGSSCEIKPVVFGDAILEVAKEGEDVGPLGIFATRDIVEGEIIMVDRTVTGVSDINSNKLEHCDACQGCLMPPYIRPDKILLPTCCNEVAFCSLNCYKKASNGYHKVLCGKNFNWLYEKIKKGKTSGAGGHWKCVNFLRVVAVVLADVRTSKKNLHPLQHPLLARMSANYPAKDKIMGQFDMSHSWLYFTNVVAPTQILLQLGVDIYTDDSWSPEVIQTIFWRVENNANMATTNLTGKDVSLVNINPNYLFFNHSCEPNVSWHGACPSGDVGIEWLQSMDGGYLQPGCSAVWCKAARDITKGEELKISYVGNPKGDGDAEIGGGRDGKRAWLGKWFDNGCGCAICEEENRNEAAKTILNIARDQSTVDCGMEDVEESGVSA
ncbi:uncharacterized protein RSE6_02967 [Rhynchosporium secalis]|uniref:SET domain-containing protein n=1 Tax=Rhynchosporium secalis TaxID=38038 RepID=A0A1E1M342_RHYSE|nr:uncharacterized protein RSE6_02967 [Rhynchosporium secalis]